MSDTANRRRQITSAFNDEDLKAFCFDYFRPVYEQITVGMTKGQMVHLLIEHCDRHHKTEELDRLLHQERPDHFLYNPNIINKSKSNQKENDELTTFCTYCGARTYGHMFCTACGARITDGSRTYEVSGTNPRDVADVLKTIEQFNSKDSATRDSQPGNTAEQISLNQIAILLAVIGLLSTIATVISAEMAPSKTPAILLISCVFFALAAAFSLYKDKEKIARIAISRWRKVVTILLALVASFFAPWYIIAMIISLLT